MQKIYGEQQEIQLNLNEIGFNYGHEKVIANFSLLLTKPGLYVFHGESGCGKTTLINLISLIQQPTAGTIEILNHKIDFKDVDQRDRIRMKIAYFFQDLNLIESLTVRENLEILALIHDKSLDERELLKYSKQIKIAKKLDITVNKLSGGERQRAALLKVMLFNYPIILLDEPTNNLDHENVLLLIDILKELSQKSMVIIVTHSLTLLAEADQAFDFKKINRGIRYE